MTINTIVKEIRRRIIYLQNEKDKLCTLVIPLPKWQRKEYEIKQELYILKNMLHEYNKSITK